MSYRPVPLTYAYHSYSAHAMEFFPITLILLLCLRNLVYSASALSLSSRTLALRSPNESTEPSVTGSAANPTITSADGSYSISCTVTKAKNGNKVLYLYAWDWTFSSSSSSSSESYCEKLNDKLYKSRGKGFLRGTCGQLSEKKDTWRIKYIVMYNQWNPTRLREVAGTRFETVYKWLNKTLGKEGKKKNSKAPECSLEEKSNAGTLIFLSNKLDLESWP